MSSGITTIRVILDLPIIATPENADNKQIFEDIRNHLCVHFADDSETQTAHDSFTLICMGVPDVVLSDIRGRVGKK